MNLKGLFGVVLVLLIVVVVFWIGVVAYDLSVNVDINPNSEQHLNTIPASFDIEAVEDVSSRINELPVSTKTFKALEESVQ